MTDSGGREARRARSEARREEREVRRADRARRRDGRTAGPAPREPVTADRISEVALGIIDAEGLAALTVRRLAAELDLGTMTLYWYVRDKEELLDFVLDRIVGSMDVPEDAPSWRERVMATARSLRQVLLAHPNAASLAYGRGSLGPRGATVLERTLGVFAGQGFDEATVANAYTLITNYVTGFAIWQISNDLVSASPSDERRETVSRIRGYIEALPPERFPNLTRYGPMLFGGPIDDRFEFGLRVVVDGIEAQRKLALAPATT